MLEYNPTHSCHLTPILRNIGRRQTSIEKRLQQLVKIMADELTLNHVDIQVENLSGWESVGTLVPYTFHITLTCTKGHDNA